MPRRRHPACSFAPPPACGSRRDPIAAISRSRGGGGTLVANAGGVHRILWANLHLLFWLSLFPAVTAWLGEAGGTWPTALYGGVLLMGGIAYRILERTIVVHHGAHSTLARAVGMRDTKANLSVALIASAIPLAFVHPWFSDAAYAGVAAMWFVPDRRIESAVTR